MRHHPRTCAITRAHAPPARRARLVGRAGHLPPSPSISLHLPPPPSLRPRLTTGGSSYGYVARALSVAPLRRQRVLSRWAELEQRGTPFALEADCPTLRTRVRWQVANEVRGRAPGLATPGGPACVLRGSSGPGAPARSTARCQAVGPAGSHRSVRRTLATRRPPGGGLWYPGAVPDARLAVRLEHLAATVLRRGAFRASCAAAPHRPPARDKPVLPVTRARQHAPRPGSNQPARLDRLMSPT